MTTIITGIYNTLRLRIYVTAVSMAVCVAAVARAQMVDTASVHTPRASVVPDSVSIDYSGVNELREVIVTARESQSLTSGSRIDRDAMTHLQPTSFSDLLELLPGNISKTPAMGAANTISLRETGNIGANGAVSDNADYAISSLGTLFMVDGAPVVGDANLQTVGTQTDASAPDARRDITNRGVDMRTLSTDNIESVEIVRGIPSAEYGNLTSGLVNIRRIKRATPLTARFKADEYSKLFFVGKGLRLGASHVLNLDLGWLDSKVDPRNSLENYKRLTASARAAMSWARDVAIADLNVGVDFTGSFDNAKTDPDLTLLKVDEYKSEYRRTALTTDLTVTLPFNRLVNIIGVNASLSYQDDRLTRRKQVAPTRASVAPTSMGAGVSEGRFLLGEYIADYVSEGKPLNLFVKAKVQGKLTVGLSEWTHKLGGDFTLSKNYGRGQVYDLDKPISAAWTSRPRAYRDIPALDVISFFAEENAKIPTPAGTLDLQAGLRTQQLLNLDKGYDLHGRVYLDPRVNAVWHMPDLRPGGHLLRLLVAGGYGLTTRMPTIDYLYPQVAYNDFVRLNYYDVNDPAGRSLVSLQTYIDDAANPHLRAARNNKWEVRFGAEWRGNRLSVTYFEEKMRSGYRYETVYRPYTYQKFDATGIFPGELTGKPDINALPWHVATVLDGFRRVGNGTRIDKRGVEFQINTKRWRALRTALTVTGAWFRSRYSNSQMLYSTVNDVVGGAPVSESYVGYYDYNDGRINDQFNTNFMFDTQVPRWGLIFTTSLQCMWWVKTTRMPIDGTPRQYLSADDGQLHDYTPADTSDPILQFLVKRYNADSFKTQKIPTAMYLNLKATKTIGRYLRVAFFVNRIIDYLPDYQSNGLTVRRSSDSYFGMELNLTL